MVFESKNIPFETVTPLDWETKIDVCPGWYT